MCHGWGAQRLETRSREWQMIGASDKRGRSREWQMIGASYKRGGDVSIFRLLS